MGARDYLAEAQAALAEGRWLDARAGICYPVNLGNEVAARGWLARAERVTPELDPNPLQGWLWLMDGYTSGDPERAHRLTSCTPAFAQDNGDIDLELVALSDLGSRSWRTAGSSRA